MQRMSASTVGNEGEQAQAGLFGAEELPASDARGVEPAPDRGAPRVMSPQRNQVELRAVDLEALLAPQHPARTVWAFVQSMDLAPLYARIKSVAGRGGAPAIDPAILVALWLWATIDGVRSPRELDRLFGSTDTDLATTILNLRVITDNLRDLTEETKRYPPSVIFGAPPAPLERK